MPVLPSVGIFLSLAASEPGGLWESLLGLVGWSGMVTCGERSFPLAQPTSCFQPVAFHWPPFPHLPLPFFSTCPWSLICPWSWPSFWERISWFLTGVTRPRACKPASFQGSGSTFCPMQRICKILVTWQYFACEVSLVGSQCRRLTLDKLPHGCLPNFIFYKLEKVKS